MEEGGCGRAAGGSRVAYRMFGPESGKTPICLRSAAGLLLIAAVATGCPGDDVPVGDETGSTSTGDPTTSPDTMSSTATASTSGPATSSSSSTTLDTDTTVDPTSSSSTDASSSETAEPTETSATTMVEESESSGGPSDTCPYGELVVPGTLSTSTLGQDSEFSSTCGGTGIGDVSYLLTAQETGLYVIDTAGSAIDTILAVYDGECDGRLIVCNNDDPDLGLRSRVSLELTEGQTVTVVVDGYGIGGGAVTINAAYFSGTCSNGDLGNTVPYSTSGSTAAGDNTMEGSCGGGSANDHAFTYTAPVAGTYTFDTEGSDFDTVLYVRSTCESGELACNDNGPSGETSRVSVVLDAGQEVVVVVDGAGFESGNFDLNIEVCPNVDIGSTVPQSYVGSTAGGTDQAAGSCGFNGGAPDVAHAFTAPATNTYVFDTNGSSYDTRLYAFQGSACSGTSLGCNDDGGDGNASLLVLELDEGEVVTLVVDGYNGQSGSYMLNVSSPVCGNGTLDPFESCEDTNLGGQTCVSLGAGVGGVLACTENCTFDTSGCTSCGDNLVNGSDVCDGVALDAMKCEDVGWAGGSLDCVGDCGSFDVSECSNDVIAVCSQPDADISSNLPTTLDTIDVGAMGTIVDVDLFLDISHTYAADLDIILLADDLGLSNTIVMDVCLGPNDVWAFFNDEASAVPGANCTEPFAIEGNLQPQSPLSVYDGNEVNGSWTLSVTDDANIDDGTLNEWCLYFTLAP